MPKKALITLTFFLWTLSGIACAEGLEDFNSDPFTDTPKSESYMSNEESDYDSLNKIFNPDDSSIFDDSKLLSDTPSTNSNLENEKAANEMWNDIRLTPDDSSMYDEEDRVLRMEKLTGVSEYDIRRMRKHGQSWESIARMLDVDTRAGRYEIDKNRME